MEKKEKKKKSKENIVFDPPIKSRFLPGEIPEKIEKMDLKEYKSHRYRILNAKPKVDNKAPLINSEVNYNQLQQDMNAWNAKRILSDNMFLKKQIKKLDPKVDCWNNTEVKHETDQTDSIKENKRLEKINRAKMHKSLHRFTDSELSPRSMAKKWKVMKEMIEKNRRYPPLKSIPRCPSITQNAIIPAINQSVHRTRCYFDLAQADNNMEMGRMVFELYEDFVPCICENFKAFCQGYNGLSYKGTLFYRIISGYYCQGGDVTKFNGTGGASIYSYSIRKENYSLQHTCPGVLTTSIGKNNSVDSNFILTFRPLRTMDGNKVVFGRIVRGMDVLFKINSFGTKYGEPSKKIMVYNCGILAPKRRNSKRGSNVSKQSRQQKQKM